jgi:hypothetical protein
MTLSGVGTDSSIKARGVTSVELTIGTKTLAAAFFVADVEGNYSLILGKDWIHANQCIPSTLHQMLIQWVGDDIEQVHADVLKGKCALGPFLSILVIECQRKCFCVDLCNVVDKVQIKSKGMFLRLSTLF